MSSDRHEERKTIIRRSIENNVLDINQVISLFKKDELCYFDETLWTIMAEKNLRTIPFTNIWSYKKVRKPNIYRSKVTNAINQQISLGVTDIRVIRNKFPNVQKRTIMSSLWRVMRNLNLLTIPFYNIWERYTPPKVVMPSFNYLEVV